ncbi:MAG: hypothetical protein FNP40_01475 [Dehalobacter sp. 4CP]|uniref:MarR family winged helix-turn-helix transcriptional regulator n=1 Tax=Dehalobacter sp. CP TaxID=2594474 RepID=UPI0013CC08E4|nr:hypothetical protein [Dehalobacter sp. 4CP]
MYFSREIMDIINVYQLYLSKNIRQFKIGLSDYPIILYLNYNENIENPGQNEIARALKRDKALIARVTRNLVKLGYIYVLTDQRNKSKKNLFLTEKGKEIAPQILDMIVKWEDEVLSKLAPEEVSFFRNCLSRIYLTSENLFDNLS